MKGKTFSITKIQTAQAVDIAKRILQPEKQIEIKGGASPWITGP